MEDRRERAARLLLAAAGVFAVIAALGLVTRVVVSTTSGDRFTVEFGSAASTCDRDDDIIHIDAVTGTELTCSAGPAPVAVDGGRPTGDRLNPEDRAAILDRARALASDHDLSEDDEDEVRRLADTFATEAGYDQGTPVAKTAAAVALGGGIALAVLCVFLSLAADLIQRPRRR
ncbi:hypothetical protein [Actinoplanes xinjiangensis]|uniref:hypothetical protein n=1 Tax=Actinoplanes xinjiangensis TaxID=512350 RepID=UPI00343D54E5